MTAKQRLDYVLYLHKDYEEAKIYQQELKEKSSRIGSPSISYGGGSLSRSTDYLERNVAKSIDYENIVETAYFRLIENQKKIYREIKNISERNRIYIMKRYFQGYTNRDIAKRTNKSIKTLERINREAIAEMQRLEDERIECEA